MDFDYWNVLQNGLQRIVVVEMMSGILYNIHNKTVACNRYAPMRMSVQNSGCMCCDA